MNRSELRTATSRLAEKAKNAQGQPAPADIAEARELFNLRTEFLTDTLGSSVSLKYAAEPDWRTWTAIAQFFDAYYAALVEIDNKMSVPLAEGRLRGI